MRVQQLAPAAMVAEVDRYVNVYYPSYVEGHLLEDGGIGDQPARYVKLIHLTGVFAKAVQSKFDSLAKEGPE
ncbi:MAG: hypothetical protein M3Z05_21100 [Gemmatimonadota bacterium]|nr:hypothetical protein [Gemmatimonadota bacterium]